MNHARTAFERLFLYLALGGVAFAGPKTGGAVTAERRAELRARLNAAKEARKQGRPAPAPVAVPAPMPRIGLTVQDLSGRTHVLAPGVDLRGLKLIGCSLAGADLTGAQLQGADLTRASLCGANLTGACLDGATVFLADLTGAIGLDLAGVRMHPFAQSAPDEPVGTLKFLAAAGPKRLLAECPRNLVCLPSGVLMWLTGDKPLIQAWAPTGFRSHINLPGDTRGLALATDKDGRLWHFGDHLAGVARPDQVALVTSKGHGFVSSSLPSPLAEVPGQTHAGPDGAVWATLSSRAVGVHEIGSRFKTIQMLYPADQITGPDVFMAVNQAGNEFFITETNPEWVIHMGGGTIKTVTLPPNARPQRIARGAGNDIWTTLQGPEPALIRYDLGGKGYAHFPLAAGREPFGLALGPDGNMWYTDRSGRLGRLTAEGLVEEFPLRPGSVPEAIVAGHDGRMFFTLKDQSRIGSIRAVPVAAGEAKAGRIAPAAATAAEAAASWTLLEPPAPPQRGSKYLKGKEREAWLEERARRAETLFAEALMGETVAPVPDPPEEKDEIKAAAPSQRLANFNITLPKGLAGYTLSKHGHERMPGKSQFSANYSSMKAFQELIASSVEAAGGLEADGSYDCEGRVVTRCRQAGVGRRWEPAPVQTGARPKGRFVATEEFIIISAKSPNEATGEYDYVIINAYPD